MRTLTTAGLVLAGFFSANGAMATPVTLSDIVALNTELSGFLDGTTWEHHVSLDASSILEATLTLSFLDDDPKDDGWFQQELAAGGIVGSPLWETTLGEVDDGDRAYDIDVLNLNDGILGVWVTSLFGDFTILTSKLDILYEPAGGPVGVPEPGTLTLLGIGLLGLGAAHRRAAKKA